jgi:hypothetical protein
MTLAELIKKLQDLTSVPDSATVYVEVEGFVNEPEFITVNNHGESITIW